MISVITRGGRRARARRPTVRAGPGADGRMRAMPGTTYTTTRRLLRRRPAALTRGADRRTAARCSLRIALAHPLERMAGPSLAVYAN
eukprot:COSAG03_NODE_3300_length_2095_cov_270.371743_3_plen_87_part_00